MKVFNINLISCVPVLVLLAAMLSSCADSSDAQDSESSTSSARHSAVVVTALKLEQDTGFAAESIYTGVVEAARSSQLAFEVGGTVVAVERDEGDALSAGQVIAMLDQDRLQARRVEAKAGLVQAEAAVALAESTLARLEEARSFDGVSAQQFDEAGNAALSAQAAVVAAQSRLNSADVDLAKTSLHAAYASVVIERFVDEGQVVAPGQAIVQVQDTAAPEVRIGVAGDQVSGLAVGQVLTLRVNEQAIDATIKSISASRDQVTRTVDVVLRFAPPQVMNASEENAVAQSNTRSDARRLNELTPAKLRPGDLARLALKRQVDAAGFWLPLTAITEGERGLWNAYVLVNQAKPKDGASHEVTSRAVELLYQDGQLAYVSGALQPGDQVVASGLNRIVPGQFVHIGTTVGVTTQ